jgi:ABC-2 type transport system ATP-binding protein
MGTAPAIEIRGLTKRFKTGVVANDGIDLSIATGSVFGLLGPNGAGKTTLARQLTGELVPTSGDLHVLGVDVVKDPLTAKGLMGIVPQEALPFDVVSAEDHLRVFGRLHGLTWPEARRRAVELLGELDLLARRKTHAWHLSGGQRRKLMVGIALMASPPVLILDEPTTGLDPRSRREVWNLISNARSAGATVLLTTHYMDEAEALCSELAFIAHGRILRRGTVEEIRAGCHNRFRATWDFDGATRTVLGPTQHHVVARLEEMGVLEYTLGRSTLEDIYLELTGEEVQKEAVDA